MWYTSLSLHCSLKSQWIHNIRSQFQQQINKIFIHRVLKLIPHRFTALQLIKLFRMSYTGTCITMFYKHMSQSSQAHSLTSSHVLVYTKTAMLVWNEMWRRRRSQAHSLTSSQVLAIHKLPCWYQIKCDTEEAHSLTGISIYKNYHVGIKSIVTQKKLTGSQSHKPTGISYTKTAMLV